MKSLMKLVETPARAIGNNGCHHGIFVEHGVYGQTLLASTLRRSGWRDDGRSKLRRTGRLDCHGNDY
jgi:hypothetical protein